jgi:MoxR-like ATPase
VDPLIVDYVVALAEATRRHPDLALGASPRSMVSLTRASQARAVAEGRDHVLPDDVKALAPAVLAHRLVAKTPGRAGLGVGREAMRRILTEVAVPLGVPGRE